MKWVVSTTALATVSVEVKADSAEEALRAAGLAPRRAWEIGEIYGDVDLDEGDVDVSPKAGT